MDSQYLARRIFAFVIDVCAVTVITCAIGMMIVVTPMMRDIVGHPDPLSVTFVAYAAYFIIMEASYLQATIGKRVMGLWVAKSEGGSVSVPRSMLRYLFRYLSLFTFGTGYLVVLFTPRRQSLHDLVSGTVVKERPRLRKEHCPCCPSHRPASAPVEGAMQLAEV